MATRSDYLDGHLAVAAIRITEHRNRILPHEEDVAELLGWHIDHTRVILRSLRDKEIVAEVRSAHDIRLKVAQHLSLEDLDRGDGDGDEISQEMADFQAKVDAEQSALDELFEASQPPPSEKKTKLQEEYEQYRGHKARNPFADDA
jgi:hypothetical protein